jgi:beta-glucosidase
MRVWLHVVHLIVVASVTRADIISSSDRWDEALVKARQVVSELSVQDKVALVSGIGFGAGACVGNIAKIDAIPGFKGLCLQDGPAGRLVFSIHDRCSLSVQRNQ